MAQNTDISLRSSIIYSIYVRNHTEEGSFLSIIDDLDRIKALGTDIIWFLPIHPIGEKNKKGSLGCPYANKDYRSVNPCYGSLDDFKTLVSEIHKRGMKVMIDVVYNHTSPDSVLVNEHPEFFFRRPDGKFGNKTADWTDIIDLDYNVKELWDYQISSLCMWASIVDGFRCDVASLIPVSFWKEARAKVSQVNPSCIWLAETVHTSFNVFNRRCGFYAGTDSEMFEAFDMEYEYDIRETFDSYLEGSAPLSAWIETLKLQESAYPDNYIKMRCMENHDQKRIASLIPDKKSRRNFTALLFFLKGSTLIYAGQEFSNTNTPSLFEKDVISRDSSADISSYLRTLVSIKKNSLSPSDYFFGSAFDSTDTAVLYRDDGKKMKIGIFSLKGKSSRVCINTEYVKIKDGEYTDLISGKSIFIKDGMTECSGEPVIFTV